MIDGAWIKIDPTWDKGLQMIFPISEWDEKYDTLIAVHPVAIYDPERSRLIIEGSSHQLFEQDLAKNGQFYYAFNEWLTENRVS